MLPWTWRGVFTSCRSEFTGRRLKHRLKAMSRVSAMLKMATSAMTNCRTTMCLVRGRWLCSRRDFIAYPLARLVETVLRRVVGLRETGFDTVPGGLGGVFGLVKLLVQLGRLVAQCLEFGFGLGLDRIAGTVNFSGELVQILVESVQLGLHGFDEFSLLREGVILHVLRGLFGFGFDRLQLLRGGLFFLFFTTAHREDSDGKDGDGECFVFHDFS